MKKLSFLLFLPFFAFLGGFIATQYFVGVESFPAPNVIGYSLETAAKKLASQRLNMRIIGEKEDSQLPANTVLDQNPKPHSNIKREQSIHLLVSSKPAKLMTPDLKGLTIEEVTKKLAPLGVKIIQHELNSVGPAHRCLFHLPSAGEVLTEEIHVYMQKATMKKGIIASFKMLSLEKTLEILRAQNISYRIIASSESTRWKPFQTLFVVDQLPKAGAELATLPESIDLFVQ